MSNEGWIRIGKGSDEWLIRNRLIGSNERWIGKN